MRRYNYKCLKCGASRQYSPPHVPCKCESCGQHECMHRTQPTLLEHVILSAKVGRLLTGPEMQEVYDHFHRTGELRIGGKVYS